jgi:hypothetical protein
MWFSGATTRLLSLGLRLCNFLQIPAARLTIWSVRTQNCPFLLLPKWNQNDLCGEGEKKGYQEAAIEEARIGWHIIL